MPRKQVGVRMGRGKKPKATVTVKIDGKWCQKSKTFDIGTDPKLITAWREEQQGKHKARPKSAYGTLGAMVEAYVPTIQAKPSARQIAQTLDKWCVALGRDRRVETTTHLDINAVLDLWARTPIDGNAIDPDTGKRRCGRKVEHGLANGSLVIYRARLRRMFNAVNGPDGFNPVRHSACPDGASEEDEGRGLPLADALAIIDAMPERVFYSKGIASPSLLKRRARVFLWTGFHPKILGQITLHDLALDAKPKPYVIAPRRKKGAGVERRLVHLTPQAVDAFRQLIAADGLGPFNSQQLNEAVQRAARNAGVQVPPGFHAYDLRHTYGSALAESGADEGTIGRLMLHSAKSRLARRYTKAVHAKINAVAIDRLAALGESAVALARAAADTGQPNAPTAPVLAGDRARSTKVRKIKQLQRAS